MSRFIFISHVVGQLGIIPGPKPLKKGTFDSNATINSEGSGDMSKHKTIKFEVRQIPSSEIGKNLHAFLNVDQKY